ncbi:MAG: DUF2007 domain-containing protein [Chloroflexi bacterium]|nr:DUF2007 domain-containing protein [Chloroflexota bacterium]
MVDIPSPSPKLGGEVLPETVYVAHGLLRAEVVRSRLESEGIPAILQFDSGSHIFGLTVDGLGEVRVLVPAPLAAQARQVLAAAEEEVGEATVDSEQ